MRLLVPLRADWLDGRQGGYKDLKRGAIAAFSKTWNFELVLAMKSEETKRAECLWPQAVQRKLAIVWRAAVHSKRRDGGTGPFSELLQDVAMHQVNIPPFLGFLSRYLIVSVLLSKLWLA
jgi:hypothetical protein